MSLPAPQNVEIRLNVDSGYARISWDGIAGGVLIVPSEPTATIEPDPENPNWGNF